MSSSNIVQEFVRQSVDYFDANTPRIEQCLDLLTDEQIWHRPNQNSNSIGNLVLHLCGNISQWILSGLGGAEDIRQRNEEFEAQGGMTKVELFSKLKKVTDEARNVIINSDHNNLLEERKVQCYEISGMGIIVHVVEHYSYHTGQIAYWTKLLLDKDLGFYDGQELD